MRWANTQKQDDNSIVMKFDKEDINFFPGQFHGVAAKMAIQMLRPSMKD